MMDSDIINTEKFISSIDVPLVPFSETLKKKGIEEKKPQFPALMRLHGINTHCVVSQGKANGDPKKFVFRICGTDQLYRFDPTAVQKVVIDQGRILVTVPGTPKPIYVGYCLCMQDAFGLIKSGNVRVITLSPAGAMDKLQRQTFFMSPRIRPFSDSFNLFFIEKDKVEDDGSAAEEKGSTFFRQDVFFGDGGSDGGSDFLPALQSHPLVQAAAIEQETVVGWNEKNPVLVEVPAPEDRMRRRWYTIGYVTADETEVKYFDSEMKMQKVVYDPKIHIESGPTHQKFLLARFMEKRGSGSAGAVSGSKRKRGGGGEQQDWMSSIVVASTLDAGTVMVKHMVVSRVNVTGPVAFLSTDQIRGFEDPRAKSNGLSAILLTPLGEPLDFDNIPSPLLWLWYNFNFRFFKSGSKVVRVRVTLDLGKMVDACGLVNVRDGEGNLCWIDIISSATNILQRTRMLCQNTYRVCGSSTEELAYGIVSCDIKTPQRTRLTLEHQNDEHLKELFCSICPNMTTVEPESIKNLSHHESTIATYNIVAAMVTWLSGMGLQWVDKVFDCETNIPDIRSMCRSVLATYYSDSIYFTAVTDQMWKGSPPQLAARYYPYLHNHKNGHKVVRIGGVRVDLETSERFNHFAAVSVNYAESCGAGIMKGMPMAGTCMVNAMPEYQIDVMEQTVNYRDNQRSRRRDDEDGGGYHAEEASAAAAAETKAVSADLDYLGLSTSSSNTFSLSMMEAYIGSGGGGGGYQSPYRSPYRHTNYQSPPRYSGGSQFGLSNLGLSNLSMGSIGSKMLFGGDEEPGSTEFGIGAGAGSDIADIADHVAETDAVVSLFDPPEVRRIHYKIAEDESGLIKTGESTTMSMKTNIDLASNTLRILSCVYPEEGSTVWFSFEDFAIMFYMAVIFTKIMLKTKTELSSLDIKQFFDPTRPDGAIKIMEKNVTNQPRCLIALMKVMVSIDAAQIPLIAAMMPRRVQMALSNIAKKMNK